MKNRIEYLDGHRGLAILLVLFYHAYVRWSELVPYGSTYANILLFKFGWLGVELFFLISGFVILMTLEKCATAKEFIYRRWLRLFPAMLICSLFIFTTSPYFHERPNGAPALKSLLPGLTFIEPTWWDQAFASPIKPLEGTFWSLYVEFKFYAFAAAAYYWKGRNFLLLALIGAFIVAIISKVTEKYVNDVPYLLSNNFIQNSSFEYFGWFTAGAVFYVYSRVKTAAWFIFGLSMTIISSAYVRGLHLQPFIAASVISLLFAGSLVSRTLQQFLNNRVLQFFGLISYPLYLLHENMMVSIIIKLGNKTPTALDYLYPFFPIAVLAMAAYVVVKFVEPCIRSLMANALSANGISRKQKINVPDVR